MYSEKTKATKQNQKKLKVKIYDKETKKKVYFCLYFL